MTLTCLVKKQMAGSTLNKGVFGHFLFLVNYSGMKVQMKVQIVQNPIAAPRLQHWMDLVKRSLRLLKAPDTSQRIYL